MQLVLRVSLTLWVRTADSESHLCVQRPEAADSFLCLQLPRAQAMAGARWRIGSRCVWRGWDREIGQRCGTGKMGKVERGGGLGEMGKGMGRQVRAWHGGDG